MCCKFVPPLTLSGAGDFDSLAQVSIRFVHHNASLGCLQSSYMISSTSPSKPRWHQNKHHAYASSSAIVRSSHGLIIINCDNSLRLVEDHSSSTVTFFSRFARQSHRPLALMPPTRTRREHGLHSVLPLDHGKDLLSLELRICRQRHTRAAQGCFQRMVQSTDTAIKVSVIHPPVSGVDPKHLARPSTDRRPSARPHLGRALLALFSMLRSWLHAARRALGSRSSPPRVCFVSELGILFGLTLTLMNALGWDPLALVSCCLELANTRTARAPRTRFNAARFSCTIASLHRAPDPQL